MTRLAFTDHKRRVWTITELGSRGLQVAIRCGDIGISQTCDRRDIEATARDLLRQVESGRAFIRHQYKVAKAHLHDQLARELGREA